MRIVTRIPALLACTAFALAPAVAAQEPAATEPAPASAPATPIPAGAPEAMRSIDREGLKAHAFYLASDELGGRFTGSEGQEKAASYIAAHFEKLGLLPFGDRSSGGRSYFQAFPVERTWLDPDATRLSVGQDELLSGFAVIAGKKTAKVDVSGTFEFCGAGSSDEMPPGSLRRKIPVVVLGASGAGERRGMMSFRDLGRARNIVGRLEGKGARVVLFCSLDDSSGLADRMNVLALLPGKPLLRFGKAASRASEPLGDGPTMFLCSAVSKRVLDRLGVTVQPGGGFAEQEPAEKPTGRVRVSVRTDKKSEVNNVVAVREGAGRLAKEAVVFSAHMDHIGTRIDGDAFNGADDNASGTSGLLEIAEAFAAGDPPQRSIVFLSVCGEELGLWGSAWYADHPTWPIGKIVADINIDMIGRATSLSGEGEISVTPSYKHAEFSTLVRDAAQLAPELGLALTIGDEFYERSDHYNFARAGVPVVFFCDGEHEDYHQVTDHADKLDFQKMERVARLAYWTGFQVADQRARPKTLGSQSGWLDGAGR